ncbi:peptidylprolyl isomerase [Sunxiuqinia sp. sy24]|uniref:peptidylprolyl isomerase n=1 Tax=Sunxiuqinia sp. sy24 TaxID=3461495 RepID=UPI0040465C80
MHSFILLFFAVVTTTFGFGQDNPEIIVTIGDHAIAKEEFVRLYDKNNKLLLDEAEKKSPSDYMDLLINFKLKVLEAERLGYDTLPGFVNELSTYRKELAKPYLTAVHYTEEMVKTAYERMQTEVNVSHILLLAKEDASPKDTLETYMQLLNLRRQLEDGSDFETLALNYSEDPSAKQNKGKLGYFSAFQMVYPFEDAAYKMNVGQVSYPVRTKFGYHLIKVNNKRAARGQIKVAHIMKEIDEHTSEEATSQGNQQLDSLLLELENGADFAEKARLHSDDQRSASSGGTLSWFSSSGMMPEFAEPAFALQQDGDLSPVIRTPYGWHIIKRLEHRPIPTFDEVEDFLAEKIRNNPEISQHNAERFIQNLKGEYDFKQDEQVLDELIKELKTAIKSNTLETFQLANPNQVLFHFADQQATAGDLLAYLRRKAGGPKSAAMPQTYNSFVFERLRQYEDSRLEAKYPEFRYLVQEYHDGILLFNISEDEIWNAAVQDSTGLVAFYEKNKSKYQWDERFHGWSIKCDNLEAKDFIDAVFDEDSEIQAAELRDQMKDYLGEVNAEVEFGFFEKGQDPLVDYLVWNAPKPDNFLDGLHFVRGNRVPPQVKTLQEAKGLYVSDYQNKLEKMWLKELRKRYKIKVNKKLLKGIEQHQ